MKPRCREPGCRQRRRFLPGELVYNILTRLLSSSKSLARFQCVCKTWQSYISSPPFKHDQPLLVSTKIDGRVLRISTYNSQGTLVINKFQYERLPRFTIPIRAVQGLMCFAGRRSLYQDEILVCNPSTGELQTLPPTPPIRDCTSHVCIGFGYVASTNEFKVVRFFHSCQVLTLSLTGGCSGWREVATPRPPYLPFVAFQPPFVNGALHLLPSYLHRNTPIVSFDLETEQYKEIQLPHRYYKRTLSHHYFRVTELQGFLCLAEQFEGHLALWLLKDYHDSRTWVIEYNIDISLFFDSRILPCAILDDGCVLFVKYRRSENHQLWCYDPRNNSFSVPIFGSESSDCFVTLYEERLLPPLGQICALLVDRDTGHLDQANQ